MQLYPETEKIKKLLQGDFDTQNLYEVIDLFTSINHDKFLEEQIAIKMN